MLLSARWRNRLVKMRSRGKKLHPLALTNLKALDHLGISQMTLSRWLKSGKIEAYRVGSERMFPKWEIELLKEQRNRKKGTIAITKE